MPRVSRLSLAAVISVGVLSATIAITELRGSIELSSVSVLADRLRNEQGIDFRTLQKVALQLGQDTSLISCRRDSLASALTVHLAYLDRLDETDNYDVWAKGIEQASTFVAAAIQCSPADGNLWLRLAMLRQAEVSLPAEIADLMGQSVELSPAQINVLLARLEVWRKMDSRGLELAEADLKSDVSRLLSYGRSRDIEVAQVKFNETLMVLAQRQAAFLPKGRIDFLSELGIKSLPADSPRRAAARF